MISNSRNRFSDKIMRKQNKAEFALFLNL